jgi:uncharacterized membrane protein
MQEDNRTLGEKVADEVAHFGGSWKFIICGAIAIAIWVSINTFLFLEIIQFDPFPYILLNLFLSMVAAFQAPFIMMSQNRAEKKQDEAYRELFREIKELIETDLMVEKRILQIAKRLDGKVLGLLPPPDETRQ